MKLRIYFILLMSVILHTTGVAQVTIGSGESPLEGAILDLKQYESTSDEYTANKGLLMPRVVLVDRYSLSPTVSDTEPNLETQKKLHKGLLVYHIGGGDMPSGLYVWDGESWIGTIGSNASEAKWFYMPGFPIDVSQDIELTVNLYNEYKKQFSQVPAFDVQEKDKLKFVVLDYDANSFSTVSIDDATSDLKYKANPASIGPKSYLNIICQILPSR